MQENKLDLKKTFLLSFGFLASSIAWTLYNAQVPLILEKFINADKGFAKPTTVIGFIMSINAIFGWIFQPLSGWLSDRTRTRFGRRMPYIFIGVPISAVAYALIPRAESLQFLMIFLVTFCFVMSLWRSPVVSLMPDLTPGPFRSQANGIVNLMGGVGAIIASLVGGILVGMGEKLYGENNGFPLPFMLTSAVMLLSLVVLAVVIREPKQAYEQEEKKKTAVKLSGGEKKSLLFILLGVFFWFVAYNAVETFLTKYAVNELGMSAGGATMTLAFFIVALVGFEVPAGIVGAKIGRRKAILIGLTGLVILFIPMIFFVNVWLTRILLVLGGVFWALVNVNSLPMVVRIAGEEKVGTFIGYYYFFSFAAQIVTPTLFGVIQDMVGHWRVLFLYACIAFTLAGISLLFVRHGED
jgi:MFS family permease